MKEFTNRVLQKYKDRATRFKEDRTRTYGFSNRTPESLERAIRALNGKYKSVEVYRKLVKGLWSGNVKVKLKYK